MSDGPENPDRWDDAGETYDERVEHAARILRENESNMVASITVDIDAESFDREVAFALDEREGPIPTMGVPAQALLAAALVEALADGYGVEPIRVLSFVDQILDEHYGGDRDE
jgi:hypothetical protein